MPAAVEWQCQVAKGGMALWQTGKRGWKHRRKAKEVSALRRKTWLCHRDTEWHRVNRGRRERLALPPRRGAGRAPPYRKGRAVTAFRSSQPLRSKAPLVEQA